MSNSDPIEFDAYSESYRAAVERSIAFSRTRLDHFTRAKVRELLRLAAQRVGDSRRLSFIDVGCGPGETDRFLEGQIGSLTGVDTSEKMVEVAQERNPWVEYRATSAGGHLPFANAVFDVCFTICVLHHVATSQRAALLMEMVRVTRPGGIVVIFEHNPWNPLTRRAVSGCEFDRDAVLLSRGESKRLLSSAGLTEVEGSYIIYFPNDSAPLRRIERLLGRLPLGAQYVVSARRE